MKLPSKLTVGKRRYGVQESWVKGRTMGWTWPFIALIEIAVHVRGKPRKPDAIAETFWHELTHAILHDMGSTLWRDEKFVTEFSKRLAKAIKTAEFK